jgi:hypothetical protein
LASSIEQVVSSTSFASRTARGLLDLAAPSLPETDGVACWLDRSSVGFAACVFETTRAAFASPMARTGVVSVGCNGLIASVTTGGREPLAWARGWTELDPPAAPDPPVATEPMDAGAAAALCCVLTDAAGFGSSTDTVCTLLTAGRAGSVACVVPVEKQNAVSNADGAAITGVVGRYEPGNMGANGEAGLLAIVAAPLP